MQFFKKKEQRYLHPRQMQIPLFFTHTVLKNSVEKHCFFLESFRRVLYKLAETIHIYNQFALLNFLSS